MKTSKKYRGSILPLAVIMVILLAIVGVGMLMLGQGTRIFAARNVADISARLAADAGITKAMHAMNDKLLGHLNNGTAWSNSSLPSVTDEAMANAYSKFTFRVDPCGTTMGAGFVATSNGTSSNRQRNVYATIGPESRWEGILVDDKIWLGTKSVFDLWPAGSEGDIVLRTNSTDSNPAAIKINSDVQFLSDVDVIIGPGGTDEAIFDKDAVISNSYAAIDTVSLSPWEAPGSPTVRSDSSTLAADVAAGGYYEYPSISLDGELTIDKPVKIYVKGNVELKSGSSLIIDNIGNNGNLVLYLGGDFVAKVNSKIDNKNKVALDLRLLGTVDCSKIQLDNSFDFCGVIDAPKADIVVMNSGDVYGAFVGKSFDLKNGGTFYYDTRVYDPNTLGYNISFVVKYWSED